MEKRKALIQRMGSLKDYNGVYVPTVLPLVSIHDFFDGSDGESGLFCNCGASDDESFPLLSSIANKPSVEDVRIALVQCEGGEWPFSDKIVIVTKATDEEILSWFPDDMGPDEIFEREELQGDAESLKVPAGYREVWLWYD